MQNIRNIAKNLFALGAAQIISAGLSLVLVILITHYIGDASYGILGFGMSLASILTIIAPLGLDQLMIREVARDKDLAAKYLGNIIVIELILSMPCFALVMLVVSITHLSHDSTAVLYIACCYCILISISGDMKYVFRAFEKMEWEALLTSIRSILTIVAGALVLFLGYGVVAVTLAYLVAAVLELGITLFVLLKYFVFPKLEFDFVFWKQIIPQGIPFAVLALIMATYTQIDVVILRAMQSDAVVGWYKAATTVAYASSIIPSIFSAVIFPVMSRFHVSSKDSLKFMLQKSVRYLALLGFPAAAGIGLLAKPIITLFYGADFSPSIPALSVLAIYIPLSFLNNVLGTLLFSMDRQRLRLFIYFASTFVRITINLLLISRLSLTGAALAILISEAFLFGLNYFFIKKLISGFDIILFLAKPFYASLGMAVLVFFLRQANLFLVVALGAAAYFAIYFALRGFDNDDWIIAKNIWDGVTRRKSVRVNEEHGKVLDK